MLNRNTISPQVAIHSGFSLLEVMIALLVISIGLLGLAGLQARSMRYNHDAFVRGQATAIANGIVDQMRSRRFAVAGDQVATVMAGYAGTHNATVNDAACVQTANSIASEIACWKNELGRLPGGTAARGTIAQNTAGTTSPNDDTYTVTIEWTDRQSTSGALTPPMTMTFQL